MYLNHFLRGEIRELEQQRGGVLPPILALMASAMGDDRARCLDVGGDCLARLEAKAKKGQADLSEAAGKELQMDHRAVLEALSGTRDEPVLA